MEKEYNIFKLPKRNGKFRIIYAPTGWYKEKLSDLAGKLTIKSAELNKFGVAHGFLPERNPVTNAESHVGFRFTLSMDLEDFFDSVKPHMVKGLLSKEELELCFIDGVARQGLPTSPAVANIAFYKADKAIIRALKKKQY